MRNHYGISKLPRQKLHYWLISELDVAFIRWQNIMKTRQYNHLQTMACKFELYVGISWIILIFSNFLFDTITITIMAKFVQATKKYLWIIYVAHGYPMGHQKIYKHLYFHSFLFLIWSMTVEFSFHSCVVQIQQTYTFLFEKMYVPVIEALIDTKLWADTKTNCLEI